MNNEQLRLLLTIMVSELSLTIDKTMACMPENADRLKYKEWVVKPEFAGQMIFIESEKTHIFQEKEGDFSALEPLRKLIFEWERRIEELGKAGQ